MKLAHTDFERWVTGREAWAPERIDEVDDSERKDDARTKNHENSCGQDALPILWAHHFEIEQAAVSWRFCPADGGLTPLNTAQGELYEALRNCPLKSLFVSGPALGTTP